jgi:hypothetical protein
MPASGDNGRSFVAGLRQRRAELAEELWNRVRAVQNPSSPAEEAYVAALQPTIEAGLEYGLEAIERGPSAPPPQVPDTLLLQARRAARTGISLDAVLRRYCAANSLFTDTMIEQADFLQVPREELQLAFRAFAIAFEGLLSAVSEEYSRVAEKASSSFDERRSKLIDRLLAGELVEGSELSYDFTAWHLGFVAYGSAAEDSVRAVAEEVDANLLSVRRRDGVVWAWLGARRRGTFAERPGTPGLDLSEASLAFGEPAQGLPGWRLTHRQAAAALPVAIKGPKPVVTYADCPLLAAVLGDDLLATSLRQLFLAPLADERDGGEVAKRTLRAYYAAFGNASSAGAALGVNRRTVAARLTSIEECLGHRLDDFSAEIQTALRLDALEAEQSSA